MSRLLSVSPTSRVGFERPKRARRANGFVAIERPKLVLIIGAVGLALNVLVLSFLHGELDATQLFMKTMTNKVMDRAQS